VLPKPAYDSLMGIIPESEWGEGNPGVDADIAPDENGWYFHSTFEEDADQWTARGESAVQISGRKPYQGGDALLVEGRTSAWHGASLSLDARAFKPGNAYSFSVHTMYLDGNDTDQFYLKLQYTNGDGDTKYATIAQGMGFKGEWFQLANTSYRIPEDASDLRIYVETAKSTNHFYLDEAVGAVDGTVIKGAGEAEPIIYGDLDQDGRITAFDMALVKRGLLGEFASVRASASADVDRNGAVEVRDAVLIQKFLFGKIQSFTSET